MTKPGPKPMPVCVRGKNFDSIVECAAHFGISTVSVWQSIDAGRADFIGTGKARPGNKQGRPKEITLGGVTYPSVNAAAHALGYSRGNALRRALRVRPERVYARAMAAMTGD